MTDSIEEARPDYQGDRFDPEPLLDATELSAILRVPLKSVYDLPIRRVRISRRRIRWRPDDVRAFIADRTEEP